MQEIIRIWNINADSIVFVDDSPMELSEVQAAHPKITCLQFHPKDPALVWDLLCQLRDLFGKPAIFEEDRLRSVSIRSGAEFQERVEEDGADTFLETVAGRIKIRYHNDANDKRPLELINKTNQFNLNGIRYSEADWNAYRCDPSVQLAVVDYEDRFGKLGKISVLAGREQNGGFEVDVWAMSCRAFSRRIEHQILNVLFGRWDPIRFRHKSTDRNGPMQSFLSEMAISCQPMERAEFSRRCPTLFQQTECIHV